MRTLGIVAYSAEAKGRKVIIHRACGGSIDTLETSDWNELVDFLTEDRGLAIHICWQLPHFADNVLDLLPVKAKRELVTKSKYVYGDTKIFYVDRLLGLTTRRQLKGNFYRESENNFYGIKRWLLDGADMPDLLGLEQAGYDILEGLAKLGIQATRLTSPIGVWADKIDPDTLPTIYNFPDAHIDAMDYAFRMAGYEWHKKYKSGKAGSYYYDLTSSYPYFIAQLPDTRHGTISRKRGNHQWGIVKGRLLAEKLGSILPIDKDAKYFTTEEIDWVESHKLGTFEIEDGFYFNFNGGKPYMTIIAKLIEARLTDDAMVNTLAKRIAQGISGKLDQVNSNGSWGELYNPILASMVRSRCRLAVADFIYDNNLQDSLVSVVVDGVRATKSLDLPSKSMPGEWRQVQNEES